MSKGTLFLRLLECLIGDDLCLKMLGKGLLLNTTTLVVFFMWLVQSFKNLEKSDFQYGFRSFRSTADLLAVVSYRTVKATNRFGPTRALAFDISKAFSRI